MKKYIVLVALALLASPTFAQEAQFEQLEVSAVPEEEMVIITVISPTTGELESKVLTVRGVVQSPQSREMVVAPRREPTTTVPTPKPLVAPTGATVVYFPDQRCTPSVETITFPDQEKVKCVAREARLAINRMNIQPGKNSPCWSFFGTMYDNCLDVEARKPLGVSYGMSPRFISGTLEGKEWSGCAAGISGDPIFVSLHDKPRSLPLVGWEASNKQLWKALDQLELTDGPLISQATGEALAVCKVQ